MRILFFVVADGLVEGRCGTGIVSFNSNWVACLDPDYDGNCPHQFKKLDSSYGSDKNLCFSNQVCCLLHPELDMKVSLSPWRLQKYQPYPGCR